MAGRLLHLRSTPFPRTVQSTCALLRGLYPPQFRTPGSELPLEVRAFPSPTQIRLRSRPQLLRQQARAQASFPARAGAASGAGDDARGPQGDARSAAPSPAARGGARRQHKRGWGRRRGWGNRPERVWRGGRAQRGCEEARAFARVEVVRLRGERPGHPRSPCASASLPNTQRLIERLPTIAGRASSALQGHSPVQAGERAPPARRRAPHRIHRSATISFPA